MRIETIRDLSQCLSTVDSAVHAHELVLSNRDLALQFVQAYDDYGIEMVKHCKQIFADDVELHCPGDPGQVSFVGVWRGPSGIHEFFNRFFAFFGRQNGSLAPMCFESNDRVVIRYVDQVYFEGHSMPPFWVNLHFQFRDGKIVRIDDEYDTRAASESFLELLKRLGRV